MKIATRALAGLCLAAIVVAGPRAAAHSQSEQGEPGQSQQAKPNQSSQDCRFWWKDADTRRELGLSEAQVRKVESEWQHSAPKIRAMHDEMDALEAELNRLIRENTADEKVIALQVDRVEARRSEINKARTLMLYRMHRALTPAQYQKLTEILERRRKERGRR
jgi:Spy/CpxP family protein refolding chaperone